MTETPDISVVIPCLNEEENVQAIVAAVQSELAAAGVTFEIVIIDNASTDHTVALVKALCREDRRVKLIVNNRNYGQMRSPTYAIFQTVGRAVIGIGADFQDPPALIGEFIAHWRAGAKIVLAVRQTEETSTTFLKLLRAGGYGFFERFADYPVIPGATGFGLYDREVVDTLAKLREPEPFFRGMLVESGFAIQTIPYVRPPRAAGETKNDFWTLLSFALSGLSGSSKKLLRAPLYLSAVSSLAAMATLLAAVIAVCLGRLAWPWLLAFVMELNLAVVLFFLGLIGDQLRIVSERTRNVPLVVEEERVNFS
jgi:glycosyltransferase involved in cell wall biosynthesis